MDIYKNNIFVYFLVCVPAISAQAWRYHRFVTGTINWQQSHRNLLHNLTK